MKLMLYVGDEGFADDQLRDGDVFSVNPDTWEPGNKEKQRFLVVQVPDHTGSWDELAAPEYAPGPGAEPIVRRMRKYRVDYASKLDSETLAQVRDKAVAVEPIVGLFTLADIARK